MPRPRRIPTYRLHKASGQAVCYVNRKEVYLGPYDSQESRQAYAKLISELTASGLSEDEIKSRGDDLTLIEICAAYLLYVEQYYQRQKYCMVKSCAKLLCEHWGARPAIEFGPLGLHAIIETMIRRKWARSYINDHIMQIKRMFKWAASREMYPGIRYADLATVGNLKQNRCDARETDDVEPVPIEDVEVTIPHLPKTVASIVRFQLYTGCRPGEARIIRPCDVEMEGPYGTWVYTPESHKNQHRGHVRQIVIGPKALAVMRPYLLRPADVYCFTTLVNKRPSTKCYTKDSYCRAVTRSAKRAGVPSWTPNRLRHTAGTDIRARFDYEAANDALGHNSFDVTKIYAKRKLEKAAKVMAEVG